MESSARKFFQKTIENAIGSEAHEIIINFTNVLLINSATFGLLLLAQKKMEKVKICFLPEGPEEYEREVITLASIEKTLSIPTPALHP